mmetsp:Transcript_36336/g.95544  ORF Transcript_36336/g.95544 Transcript_36336/m.95544 type:complete len:237 (-) Transcript_36336:157-867(-)
MVIFNDNYSKAASTVREILLSAGRFKHPYVCVINYNENHLIVMKDMGRSLRELAAEADFLREWSQGQLARDLCGEVCAAVAHLDAMPLSHNDIRTPNIVFDPRWGGFCLVDFDFATEFPSYCRLFSQRPVSWARLWLGAVQLALVVHELDLHAAAPHPPPLTQVDVGDRVKALYRHYLSNGAPAAAEQYLREFSAWAGRRHVAHVFREDTTRQYWNRESFRHTCEALGGGPAALQG